MQFSRRAEIPEQQLSLARALYQYTNVAQVWIRTRFFFFTFSNLNSSLGFASSLPFCFLICKMKTMIATPMGDSKLQLPWYVTHRVFEPFDTVIWCCGLKMCWAMFIAIQEYMQSTRHRLERHTWKSLEHPCPIELFKMLLRRCGRDLSIWSCLWLGEWRWILPRSKEHKTSHRK